MEYLNQTAFFFPFFFFCFVCTEMCSMSGADFVKGQRAEMMDMRRAGSPSGTLHQDALLCFQRRLYDVSHGLWFQVNKTVM